MQAIRGMKDILPTEMAHWHWLETTVRMVLESYGYQEIRTPLLEKTELFCRSIGEVTDIVEKEMYTFLDRNGESLTLRPEGTASCVRAGIEHGLFHSSVQRLWYMGPMFRHERPQKERYRQFYQIGVEVYGLATPDIDAEVIAMSYRLWRKLGIDNVTLQINSLGSNEARLLYRQQLIDYFSSQYNELDEDSQRRLQTNPLRILDSKNPEMQTLINAAPQLLTCLDAESKAHFEQLCALLTEMQIPYEVNPRLVRGLDYYNRTVFEWVTETLGAQGTICAGGRYDGLVEQIGGKSTPAFGFALGMERIIALLQHVTLPELTPHVYLILVGDTALLHGLKLAETVRSQLPQLRLLTHCGGGSFKSQFKRADKSGAQVALVLGEDELQKQTITIKYLRSDQPQICVNQTDLADYLKPFI